MGIMLDEALNSAMKLAKDVPEVFKKTRKISEAPGRFSREVIFNAHKGYSELGKLGFHLHGK